jgi:hypothetical protein
MFTDGDHDVTQAEAAAVQRLLAPSSSSALPVKDAEAQLAGRYFQQCLPLHLVAWRARGPRAGEVFRHILNAFPSAAKEKENIGLLPLHYAAAYMGDDSCGLEAIQLLLTEYPQAAMQKDIGGELPIHLLCTKNKKATLAMVRELLSAYPNAINEGGFSHQKPYERAAYLKYLPADAIKFLQHADRGRLSLS